MMKRLGILWSMAAMLVVVPACDAGPPAPDPPPATTTIASSPPATPTSSPRSDEDDAYERLAELDPRQPVPLLPMMAWHQKQNMMQHLEAVHDIIAAVPRDDWEAISKAASSIGLSPQMANMCEHMGSGAPGFTEMALGFHRQADEIGTAAKRRDRNAVLAATAATLQTCTKCHAAFRQDVVGPEAWKARTGSHHEAAPHLMPSP